MGKDPFVHADVLRAALRGGPTFHALCLLPSADVTEIIARAGFDWLLLDMQHGLTDREVIVNMLRAAEAARTPAMIRVPCIRPELLGWALDSGAGGVVAPAVSNAKQARELVSACRYPPNGERGWGSLRSMIARPDYSTDKGDRVVVAAMIETREALEELDGILDVSGIDLIMIGQSDLSVAYGLDPVAGRSNPDHRSRLARIGEACRQRGLPIVINCSTPEEAAMLRKLGFDHFGIETDFGILRRTATAAVDVYRAANL